MTERGNRDKPLKALGIYHNRGGGDFKCLWYNPTGRSAGMRNTKTGWTFVAYGVAVYDNGDIEWDYSTDGYFYKEDGE